MRRRNFLPQINLSQTHFDNVSFQKLILFYMNSEDELLTAVAAVVMKSKAKNISKDRRTHKVWVQYIYIERNRYGVTNLGNQMSISSREGVQFSKIAVL